VTVGDLHGLAAIGQVRPHSNDPFHAGCQGTGQDLIPVTIELSHLQVGVAINEHGFWKGP
jgi:hypothetical protein